MKCSGVLGLRVIFFLGGEGVRSQKKSRGGVGVQWKIMSSLGGGGQILNGIAKCK